FPLQSLWKRVAHPQLFHKLRFAYCVENGISLYACNYTPACRWAFFFKATLDRDKFYKYIHNSASTAVAFTEVLLSKPRAALILLPVINHAGLMKRLTSLPG
ncbi:hypothetical protein WDU19_20445, partial [Klebsiella pneumoniae]